MVSFPSRHIAGVLLREWNHKTFTDVDGYTDYMIYNTKTITHYIALSLHLLMSQVFLEIGKLPNFI